MSKLKQKYCFTSADGKDISLLTLTNNKGSEVTITNYGAIITSFKVVQADGSFNDIVLGFDTVEEYFSEKYVAGNPYFGAAIGRYGNRIKNAIFTLDEKTYSLATNNGSNNLHGGITGFDKKVWELIAFTDATLTLQYISANGEEGFPGTLTVTIKFELTDTDELSYEYTASCDHPTIVNLTHHSYFNLEKEKGNINDHFVRIAASNILEQDEGLAATGNLIPVTNTKYDFTNFKQICKDLDATDFFDQSFVLTKTNELLLVAEAFSKTSNLKLQVFSTEPVVHFYTGKWIPEVIGKNNIPYTSFSGFCLETQKHPNAINIPSFPNTILRPGEIYNTKTMYRVITN